MGKRTHSSLHRGAAAPGTRSTRNANHAVRAIATTPIRAFWVVLTIAATCRASSPARAPAAVTAAVVSMFPPIHAPATAGERPSASASAGRTKIDGRANRMTRLAAYASCSFLACTAPAALIAALTPQIDTALASSARSLVVHAETSAEPPREPEDQRDEQDGLRDGGPGCRHDERQVHGRPEQHEAGLDEELGPEGCREPRPEARGRQHGVAEEAERDRVHRVLDGLRDAAEGRVREPLGDVLLEEAGQPGQAQEDDEACDQVGGPG